MKNLLSVPAFDVLKGGSSPTEMFGDLLSTPETLIAVQALSSMAREARSRVEQSFGQVIEPTLSGMAGLDRIIQGMWESGWSPQRASFNLFCTDFGALYSDAFFSVGGLSPVLRSSSILDHTSFWQSSSQREYFPFHKISKALSSAHGDNLVQMFEAAQQTVPADRPKTGSG